MIGPTLVERGGRRLDRMPLPADLNRATHIDWYAPVSAGREPVIQLWTVDPGRASKKSGHAVRVAVIHPDGIRGTTAHAQLIAYFGARGGWSSTVDLRTLAPPVAE